VESTDLHRQLVLTVLDLIFLQDRKRMETIEFYRKAWAEARWVLEQVLPYVPDFAREHVQAELEKHRADPTFDFHKAVFGKEAKPLKPLAVHLQEHSSTG
jgi:hypothetical protein